MHSFLYLLRHSLWCFRVNALGLLLVDALALLLANAPIFVLVKELGFVGDEEVQVIVSLWRNIVCSLYQY